MPACPADCGCHTGGPDTPCTTPGGCGSAGCGRAVCTLCPTLRAGRNPRTPHREPVCDGCRLRFDRLLHDLWALHERLVNPDPAPADQRRYQTLDTQGRPAYRWADPLAPLGGAGPVPGRTNQPHVSGSHQPGVPINLDAVDLTSGARVPNPTDHGRRHAHDQIGHLSTATLLYEIARDWRDTLWPDQHLPAPTVPELVAWLRAGHTETEVGPRIDDACNRHPGIAATANELWEMRGWLRHTLGDTDPLPRRWIGVTCGGCKQISRIARHDGDEYAECGGCGRLHTDAELAALVAGQAGEARGSRSPEQVAELLKAR